MPKRRVRRSAGQDEQNEIMTAIDRVTNTQLNQARERTRYRNFGELEGSSSVSIVGTDHVLLPGALRERLLNAILGRYPKKSFGYLVSLAESHHPTDFVLFEENIRNDDDWRHEFESRGRYFVDHPDAGFVATPTESWRVQKYLFERGLREVAVFHTHRRHPGNFSDIDYDLHVSRFSSLWHLIISLRNPRKPQLRAFAVSQDGVREMDLRNGP